jgi:predicted nucleic acid-binding protein
MILCDTNILIEFYKDNETVKQALRQVGLSQLAVSIITTGELYFGAKDKRELVKIERHLALLNQVALDAEISAVFLKLMGQYVLNHKLSVPDGLIAATALRHAIPLYTLNIKDFKFIPGLELYMP